MSRLSEEDREILVSITKHEWYSAHRCLGSDGYTSFLPVAIEVAGERSMSDYQARPWVVNAPIADELLRDAGLLP